MNENEINEKISKIAEISHINFLFGAGTSAPYIPVIPEIEESMNKAQEEKEIIKLKKEFFSKVIAPCLNIKSYSFHQNSKDKKAEEDIAKTYKSYRLFFREITKYLLSRKSTLLDKQVNLFTTNIDIFMEKILEDIGAYYNDGFIGHMMPSFRTSHFQTIAKKKSEYFEQQSEIPTFNLYKLHGSLTWKLDNEREDIVYSDLSILEQLEKLENSEFNNLYSTLQIVNPNSKKFETSTIESTYYELLRLYATALEKENALLIVVGFSFNDKHILDITRRAIDSNPTLTVCICSHSKENLKDYEEKFKGVRYVNNVEIIKPSEKEKIDLQWMTNNFISKLDRNKKENK